MTVPDRTRGLSAALFVFKPRGTPAGSTFNRHRRVITETILHRWGRPNLDSKDGSKDCLAIFLTEELIQESRAGGLRVINMATTLTSTSSRMAVVTTMATG